MKQMMRFRTKQRIVKISLAILAVWPLIHIGVVHKTGISPWRGFGWGMYTEPVLDVQVELRPLEADASSKPSPTQAEQAALLGEMKNYIKRYQALGANAKPGRIANAVLSTYPHFRSFEINAFQYALDNKTALIVEDRSDRFTYRRSPNGDAELVPSRSP